MQRMMNMMVITLFLGGDVMTGRGIDQALPHPSPPSIHEAYVTDARTYLHLAEEANGPIPKSIDFTYIWGDASREWALSVPDVRLVNLETAVTGNNDYWRGKGINYRMNPDNIPVLTAAKIDVVSLANNHVLDWGYEGLSETIRTLDKARIHHAGAGKTTSDAGSPAVIDLGPKGRVLVFSLAHGSSGVPPAWGAEADRAGVNLIPDLSDATVNRIAGQVQKMKKPGDVVVLSIHWSGNWGYDVSQEQVRFSHRVIDDAAVDVVHGHSSHNVKPVEVYRNKLILYGCGDLMNDYEGIKGHESFRPDLALMYFAEIDPASGTLLRLDMTPLQVRNFRLNRASPLDAAWLAGVLNREGKVFGTSVVTTSENRLRLRWKQ
jgi:poly-gamma-glutamate capsule biosynthesis protein CapA/YwtB (metallophosphatase superfamily)